MTTSMKMLLSAVGLFVLVGCADGANGDKGKVRFSQMVNFVETDDFTPPLVVNRTVLIRLEHPGVVEQSGFPELSLEVTGGTNQVLPLGFAQFAVRLDEEKDYRFRAKQGALELDALTVHSKKAVAMRLHGKATVVTTAKANGKTCVKAAQSELDAITLAPNQEATYFVVPVDGNDKAMLGMLQLTARTSRPDVVLDTPIFLTGGAPNALTVKPTLTSAAAGEATVEIADPSLPTITQTVRFTSTEATASCQ